MSPFDENRRDSGATPVTPEHETGQEGNAHSPAQDGHPHVGDGHEIHASVPAGDPEAPVGPVADESDEGPGPAPARSEADVAEGEHDTTHERQLERDIEELTAKAEKADEYLELARRTRADFENYRKRAAREAAAAQERGVVKLVRELLPAVDNLDRALEAVNASDESDNGKNELVSGIKLVHAELIAALARAGVERFDPEGERFDPQHHEAVGQQQVDGAESGTIIAVYQRGYRFGDAVIRPARVLVAG